MNSLNIDKEKIDEAFLLFIKKERIIFKGISSYSRGSYREYDLVIKNINYDLESRHFNFPLSNAYLWGVGDKQTLADNIFDFGNCDFSFYFKFIRESQDLLNAKETAFLLESKLFASPSNIIDELVTLNNADVNDNFFTHSFLIANLSVFIENYKRFSFSHEQDKCFFDVLENTVEFKKDDFRNKVYKLVNQKFTNPDFFKERFPSALDIENAELFTSNSVKSFYLNVRRDSLYGFNLMREYPTKDIDFLLHLMIGRIGEHGEFFGINNYMFPEKRGQASKKEIVACFFIEDNNIFKADLLHNVFNRYVLSILSENTFEGAMEQISAGNILEKIMLEKKIIELDLTKNSKYKI